jgi:hypothetical protein
MRPLLLSAALAALLLACSPPAQREAEAPSSEQAPQVQACNAVAPNLSRTVRVEDAEAVASAASDLRGGSIAPGVYDLTRAVRIGEATGWQGERAVALEVSEDAAGAVTFNWAGAAPGGAIDTWTATFADTAPNARLSYTCGRMGAVDASFAASANALQLRLPDGASGSLQVDFQRRS